MPRWAVRGEPRGAPAGLAGWGLQGWLWGDFGSGPRAHAAASRLKKPGPGFLLYSGVPFPPPNRQGTAHLGLLNILFQVPVDGLSLLSVHLRPLWF